MRKTGLEKHRDAVIEARNRVTNTIKISKKNSIQNSIASSSQSQKALFRCIDELFGKTKKDIHPSNLFQSSHPLLIVHLWHHLFLQPSVRKWMHQNKLKLNYRKTEFIIFGTETSFKKVQTAHIRVGTHIIERVDSVRNIGAIFDEQMRMEKQVGQLCMSGWLYLYKINKIRQYLTTDQVIIIIIIIAYFKCHDLYNIQQHFANMEEIPLKKCSYTSKTHEYSIKRTQ